MKEYFFPFVPTKLYLAYNVAINKLLGMKKRSKEEKYIISSTYHKTCK